MKKNIIFLLIDCFDYTKIGANEYRPSPTPFLDSLKENSFWAENMYAQAPYTEAALNATMCGYDTLQYGGYLKRYKYTPETMFEMVKRAGYTVYAQMWPHIYPSSAFRGIDELLLRPFNFNTLWGYRLSYYADLYASGELDDTDWLDMIDLLDDNLSYWCKYYQLLLSENDQARLILDNMDVSRVSSDNEKLVEEYARFLQDERLYVKNLLEQKREHILFTLFSDECLNHKVKKSELCKEVSMRYSSLIQNVYRTNNQRNRRNTHLSLRKLAHLYKTSNKPLRIWNRTPFSQYLRNYYRVCKNDIILEQLNANYDMQKDSVSLNTYTQYFFSWLEDRKTDAPFFAYIHSDDIHGNSAIFDYCCEEEEELSVQFQKIEQYVSSLPKGYRGNLEYDLGLLNIDRQIERFHDTLKQKGILENTILVITSDHGCGTNYEPLRDLIQSFHEECYHVPFVMIHPDNIKKRENKLLMTKDILPTIAALVGVVPDNSVTGIDIFGEEQRACVTQEYMGGGCPDMYRRPVWMCAFDKRWKVHIEVKLSGDFTERKICEIYDLTKDPKELVNLVFDKQATAEVEYLLQVLERRWRDIRTNYERSGNYESIVLEENC